MTAGPTTQTFKNILVIRTDRIGDVVLTTPLLGTLRQAFPSARITMLVSPTTRDLVEGNPYLDEVLVDERRGWTRGWDRFVPLIAAIRARHFDLALNLHTKRRTNLLCFLSGIPRRVGWRGKGKYGFLLTDSLSDERVDGARHESDYIFDLVRLLGVEVLEKEFFIPLSDDARAWVERFCKDEGFQGQKLVAVHVGSSCLTKRWPPEAFLQVIDGVLRHPGMRVVLVGGADTLEPARRIAALRGEVVNMTGKTTLGQLAAFLKRCELLISNDSGPVHIAAALGTPVVSVFTRNQPGLNPERWRPLEPRSRVVAPLPQKGSDTSQGTWPRGSVLLGQVSPEEVLRAVDGIFKLC